MTISAELRDQVRMRANFACEYCGVAESDTGGLLTVDHFQPQARGGSDEIDNLLYCCHACNQFKADYWPGQATDLVLWNPRTEPRDQHLLLLDDGTLHPLTTIAAFTLKRLRLNRPPLVTYRTRQLRQAEEVRLLKRYREVIALLEQLHQEHVELLEEHRSLLEKQWTLLRALIDLDE
jgi:HNH endonuclease